MKQEPKIPRDAPQSRGGVGVKTEEKWKPQPSGCGRRSPIDSDGIIIEATMTFPSSITILDGSFLNQELNLIFPVFFTCSTTLLSQSFSDIFFMSSTGVFSLWAISNRLCHFPSDNKSSSFSVIIETNQDVGVLLLKF